MAFGFLKKLVAAVTGRKPANGGKANRPQGGTSGNGRGKHGKRGRHGKGGDGKAPARTSSMRSGSTARNGGESRGARNGESRNASRANASRHNRGERRTGRESGRGRGPVSVNTAAGEMRPGGVISAEEMAKRQAEHAAWSVESFQVAPQEGKRRFHDFDLPGEVMHGIADLGFQYCTDIQALSLEHALEGKNVAGKAQTGSGKTAAFLVAILTRYLRTPDKRAKAGGCPRALVIAPTRELVIQICQDAAALGKYTGLRSLAVYGGMDLERQAQELLDAPVDLLVATPDACWTFASAGRGASSPAPTAFPPGATPTATSLTCATWTRSSSTRPTACWTWASFPT